MSATVRALVTTVETVAEALTAEGLGNTASLLIAAIAPFKEVPDANGQPGDRDTTAGSGGRPREGGVMAGRHAEIREAKDGWILLLPFPYGPEVIGLEEVVCKTWEEAMKKLREPFAHIIEEREGR